MKSNHFQLWKKIKSQMSKGIAAQRQNYLIECMTPTEMKIVENHWKNVKTRGLDVCGKMLTETALRVKNCL